MEQFWNEKLLGPDITYNHCNALTDATWQKIRDSGGTVNVCARSDPQYVLGEGIPAFQKPLITECGRPSASTMKSRMVRICLPKCASSLISSGRGPRIDGLTVIPRRNSQWSRMCGVIRQVRHVDAWKRSRRRHDSDR
jgi:hypothetical protein